MNFVNQLEEYLRDLGAEARKKHPGMVNFVNDVFFFLVFLGFHFYLFLLTHLFYNF